MAFADPQSLTIAGVAVSLPRTSFGTNTGGFTSNDGLVKLSVASTYGRRTRRTLRLEHSKTAPDPFVTGQTRPYSMTAYVVVDTPVQGYTVAQQKEIVDALSAYMTLTSGANVTKMLGGEN